MNALRQRIATQYSALSPTERRVADHVCEHMGEVVTHSALQIGRRAGVSDATVVRAVRALGFEGLADLRGAIVEAMQSQATPAARLERTLSEFAEEDTADVRACLDMVRGAVDEVGERVSDAELRRARDLIGAAPRVVLAGYGLSLDICRYLAAQMRRIGLSAEAIGASGPAFADDLCRLRADDLVLLFAYTAVSPEADALLDECAALGAQVILVTDGLDGDLRGRVALVLRAGRGKAGMYSVHAGTLTLFEGLLLAVAYANRERAQRRLRDLQRLRGRLRG
jgi:DNA-binding MurR/RpiR family transcriptional regulator